MNTKKLIALMLLLAGLFVLSLYLVVPILDANNRDNQITTNKSDPAKPLTPEDRQVEEGVKAYNAGDYDKAKALIVPLAEQGHPKAMNIYGLMHDYGKGFPENPTKACDWYEKAALVGYPAAQWNFSFCYSLHEERSLDPTRGLDSAKRIYWITKAAENEYTQAQAILAMHYSDIDREKYLYWGKKASAKGSAVAKTFMAMNKDGLLISPPTIPQMICAIVMVGFLDKDFHYCD